ncbi:unnamed protein product [Callosobruchus maculatus]|uniref:Uncharacterized protein n=1 Tax=Callosobruchus maculatus TaxID=64391 RepID=A0A653BVV2_CALMS|nr:unnamed protein product [Callosobruchus maculatus]
MLCNSPYDWLIIKSVNGNATAYVTKQFPKPEDKHSTISRFHTRISQRF